MAQPLRLISGMSVLERWSKSASQADKNVVYEALFAVVEGTVLVAYDILEADPRPPRFFVLVKEGLGTEIRMHRADGFGIVYIGAPEGRESVH